jgi:hypothetical protein
MNVQCEIEFVRFVEAQRVFEIKVDPFVVAQPGLLCLFHAIHSIRHASYTRLLVCCARSASPTFFVLKNFARFSSLQARCVLVHAHIAVVVFYEVTLDIDTKVIEPQALIDYMRNKHLPEMLATRYTPAHAR